MSVYSESYEEIVKQLQSLLVCLKGEMIIKYPDCPVENRRQNILDALEDACNDVLLDWV